MAVADAGPRPAPAPAPPPGEGPPRPAAADQRRRIPAALAWPLAVVGLLVFTQLVLAGDNSPGRGTPAAILFQGLVGGAVIALSAAGLVLVYRSIRIINFAGVALGVAPALFAVTMVAYHPGFPFVVTLLLALAIGALAGTLIDLAFGRRFARAPRLVLTVVSITGGTLLVQTAFRTVTRAPWLPPLREQTSADLAPDRIPRLLPFPGFDFQVGSLPLKFGFAHLLTLELAAVLLIALGLFFKVTKLGTAVRASAENAERASLLGISTGLLGTVVWAIAGVLAAAGSTMNAFAGNPAGFAPADLAFLLPPLAAAVLARFRSLPIAVGASLGLGVLIASLRHTFGAGTGPVAVAGVLVAITVVGLVVQRRDLLRVGAATTSSWQAAEEPRPVPKELLVVGGIRAARVALALLALAVVVAFPFFAPVRLQVLGGSILLTTVAALSLVVLTGWAGQVSLGQYAFVGVGAFVAGALAKAGVPFVIVVPLAVAATAALAMLVGLPALRIQGLFLAGATFGFAVLVGAFLSSPRFGGRYLPTNLERPKLVFVDFDDERSMYFLCLATLVAAIVVVVNLRRSRFGRLLIAIRENEQNVQSFGVRATRTKLYAFMLAGGLAGLAGAILEYQVRGIDGRDFQAAQSFNLFVVTVLGGVSAPAGALLGAAYSNGLTYFFGTNEVVQLLAPMLPLLLLFSAPGGILSLALQLRDAVLRIVAQRRQIVVPSLFADYDADSLERRLVPMAERSMTTGLAALPHDARYALASDLYRGRGQRIIEKLRGPRRSDVQEALAAADDATPEPPALPPAPAGAPL